MRPIITEQEPDTEENVDKKEEKKFSVSLAIFNTFRSNWQKRKKEILNIVDDDPSRSDEVNQAINNTEEAIKYFDNAAKRYSEAAKNAKIEFDKAKEKGITSGDRVKDFFGFTTAVKDLENRPMFVLSKGTFTFQPAPENQNKPALSIKQVLSFDSDLVPFTKNPDPKIAKKQVLKMLSYKKLSQNKAEVEVDEVALDNMSKVVSDFDPENFFKQDLGDFFNNISENQQDENITKFKSQLIDNAKNTMVKYITTYKRNKNINNTFKKNLVMQYSKEPSIVVFYQFGTNTTLMENDPFLSVTKNKNISVDKNKILQYLADLLTTNNIKFDLSNLGQIIVKKDWQGFVQLLSGPSKQEPTSNQLIVNFLKKNKQKVKNVQEKPPLFLSKMESEELDAEEEFYIDDIYLMGNEYFKDLSEDRETMKVLEGLVKNNANILKKTSNEKIKEVHKKINEIEDEKLKEQIKDLNRIYKYILENKEDVTKDFDIDSDAYRKTWNTLENAINTSDPDYTKKIYNDFYQFLKIRKPELLKYFKEDTPSSVDPDPESNLTIRQQVENIADDILEESVMFSYLIIENGKDPMMYDKDANSSLKTGSMAEEYIYLSNRHFNGNYLAYFEYEDSYDTMKPREEIYANKDQSMEDILNFLKNNKSSLIEDLSIPEERPIDFTDADEESEDLFDKIDTPEGYIIQDVENQIDENPDTPIEDAVEQAFENQEEDVKLEPEEVEIYLTGTEALDTWFKEIAKELMGKQETVNENIFNRLKQGYQRTSEEGAEKVFFQQLGKFIETIPALATAMRKWNESDDQSDNSDSDKIEDILRKFWNDSYVNKRNRSLIMKAYQKPFFKGHAKLRGKRIRDAVQVRFEKIITAKKIQQAEEDFDNLAGQREYYRYYEWDLPGKSYEILDVIRPHDHKEGEVDQYLVLVLPKKYVSDGGMLGGDGGSYAGGKRNHVTINLKDFTKEGSKAEKAGILYDNEYQMIKTIQYTNKEKDQNEIKSVPEVPLSERIEKLIRPLIKEMLTKGR